MRAFDFNIKSQLTRGLRLDSRGDRGLNLLTECKNLKPIKIDDDNLVSFPMNWSAILLNLESLQLRV